METQKILKGFVMVPTQSKNLGGLKPFFKILVYFLFVYEIDMKKKNFVKASLFLFFNLKRLLLFLALSPTL